MPAAPSLLGEPVPSQAATASVPSKVVVPPTPGFESALHLMEAPEEQLGLHLSMRFQNRCVLVTPPSEETLQSLLDITPVQGKLIQLRKMGEATTNGMVTAHPIAMPLKPLRHPKILSTERCESREGLTTRQVIVSVKGQLLGSLDLGSCGTFYTRPCNKEPLRCFKCQQ